MQVTINHIPGIVTITNTNTTIAYCRYTETGEIEYIFVNKHYRRRGYARQILFLVESRVQCRLRFHPPISPMGATLQRFYETQAGAPSAAIETIYADRQTASNIH